jgi:hypothetical protein
VIAPGERSEPGKKRAILSFFGPGGAAEPIPAAPPGLQPFPTAAVSPGFRCAPPGATGRRRSAAHAGLDVLPFSGFITLTRDYGSLLLRGRMLFMGAPGPPYFSSPIS